MKKVLVLVADYPNLIGGVTLMYVHVRNKYYIQHDINVTVLNFRANEDYEIDGIRVITKDSYVKNVLLFDVLICHAPNIRNHYMFLKKYGEKFPHFIFFFHGHECVRISKVYPKPYNYVKGASKLRQVMQDYYDSFKLSVWHKYLPEVAGKSDFIFVSKCFFAEFKHYVSLSEQDLQNNIHIIHNSVGSAFEVNSYHYIEEKRYDFITIRNHIDDSNYCVDLIDELAKQNPHYQFLLIGKGDFFKYNRKTDNLTWIDKYLSHEELLLFIDKAKCALMPTRRDTQGVMSCELVAYGIPLITSDLEICKEIFENLHNVEFIHNEDKCIDIKAPYERLLINLGETGKTKKYGYEDTVKREEDIIKGCSN